MNSRTGPKNGINFFLILVLIVVLIFNFTFMGDFARNAFLTIASPVKSLVWSRGISVQSEEFKNTPGEKSRLVSEIVELKNKVKEMEELRTALDLDAAAEFDLLDVRVISGSTEGDMIIINRGKKHGIKEGMPIITSSKSLVGSVEKSLNNFSYVGLITGPEIEFDGIVLEKDNSLGVVKSEEGIILDMVSREADLEAGDLVVTHPGGGVYPGGIYIGEISEIIKNDAEAFQSASVIPGFNPRELDFLFAIINFN